MPLFAILAISCSFWAILLLRNIIKDVFWSSYTSWYPKTSNDIESQARSAPGTRNRPRLSRDPSLMKAEYDVVVIGSGYGGGVAASRMSRAGKSVCVLEQGTERWPGEFPHTLKSALREYRVSGTVIGNEYRIAGKTGLYHSVRGEGQDVFSGCGLGGTSLINAGVFLRAETRVLENKEWPMEIRGDVQDLESYYRKAEHMLRPEPYPSTYPEPRKLSVIKEQARALGLKNQFYKPPLTIQFRNGLNEAGIHMQPSTGTGNECTGSNDGSKQSVLVTYLADAWHWGAEIFCDIHVRYVRKADSDNGYTVFYEVLDNQGTKRTMWVRAREIVFLGAGALGTPEILLRSRLHGLSTSPLLGQKISGNGDLLAFAYNCDRNVNAVGCEEPSGEHCGPTITGCIDLRHPDHARVAQDGIVIQEGAVPEALAPVIQAWLESQIRISTRHALGSLSRVIARLKSLAFGPYSKGGSVDRTAVYLVMSHDRNEGTLTLEHGTPSLQWSGSSTGRTETRLNDILTRATLSIGGTFIEAPRVTVHPLGGACMSSDHTGYGGVVNHLGQLYNGTGDGLHDEIVCVDASVIPTSLGVNPCATITALAERSCALIARDRNWEIDESPNGVLGLEATSYELPGTAVGFHPNSKPGNPRDLSCLEFDEVLEGFVHVDRDGVDFRTAYAAAKEASSSARLSVNIALHRQGESSYRGAVTGSFSCGAVSQDPLLITAGTVKFFEIDPEVSDAVNLMYDLDLLDTNGRSYKFHAFKRIDPSIAFSVSRAWAASTTLYTTITRSDGMSAWRGILQVSPWNFLAEFRTFRNHPGTSFKEAVCSRVHFWHFFLRNVADYMAGPFRTLRYYFSPSDKTDSYKKPTPTVSRVTAADGVVFEVKKWEASPGADLKSTPIVLIAGASVDDRVFSLPTVSTNTIDFFTSQGYNCYVTIPRYGNAFEAKRGWTVFDARLDIKAALEHIREKEGNRKIYAIVHCLGSIAMATALLHGDVKESWLCGMTCSQVFSNLVYSPDNQFKAKHTSILKTYKAYLGDWFSFRSAAATSWLEYLLDQALRFYPVGSRAELCNSAPCHRGNVPFGRCWTHANLNHATHAELGNIFSGIHTTFLEHLCHMGAAPPHHVQTNIPDFDDPVTADNMKRLEGLRMFFVSGSENAVWSPNATKRTFDMFQDTFPDGAYERFVVQGYGHLDTWMGKDAYLDVYPRVLHHLRSCEVKVTES